MNSLICLLIISACASLPKQQTEPPFLVSFHECVISGQKPSISHYPHLASMGVKTIICVDSVPPNVIAAKKYDIETIHIPMHYGMQSESKRNSIVSATHYGLQRGNVYIHCHHGKHRSAAAAGIALVGLGLATKNEMHQKMNESGTSPAYCGLWDSVDNQNEVTDIPVVQFRARVMPEGMTKQMIEINRAFERLKLAQSHHWNVPESHPDVAPASDAGLIVEVLREIQVSDELNQYPYDFETQIVNAMHHASGLEDALSQVQRNTKIDYLFNQVEQSCRHCHDAYRGKIKHSEKFLSNR
ncbi:MAG: hypothetical protein MK073_07035 [Phycisphaerales bacterium]|nr:hypothetical protein [Phycisphaerales bacterium]